MGQTGASALERQRCWHSMAWQGKQKCEKVNLWVLAVSRCCAEACRAFCWLVTLLFSLLSLLISSLWTFLHHGWHVPCWITYMLCLSCYRHCRYRETAPFHMCGWKWGLVTMYSNRAVFHHVLRCLFLFLFCALRFSVPFCLLVICEASKLLSCWLLGALARWNKLQIHWKRGWESCDQIWNCTFDRQFCLLAVDAAQIGQILLCTVFGKENFTFTRPTNSSASVGWVLGWYCYFGKRKNGWVMGGKTITHARALTGLCIDQEVSLF